MNISEAAMCPKCNTLLTQEAVLVDGKLMHPHCFQCSNCKIGLDDRFSYIRRSCSFCSKCYHLMYLQRCSACCKPLKNECINAQSVFWHFRCFRCISCRTQLVYAFYTLNLKQPYCFACYIKEQNDLKPLPEIPFTLPLKNGSLAVTQSIPSSKVAGSSNNFSTSSAQSSSPPASRSTLIPDPLPKRSHSFLRSVISWPTGGKWW